jgi:hypothetical protein
MKFGKFFVLFTILFLINQSVNISIKKRKTRIHLKRKEAKLDTLVSLYFRPDEPRTVVMGFISKFFGIDNYFIRFLAGIFEGILPDIIKEPLSIASNIKEKWCPFIAKQIFNRMRINLNIESKYSSVMEWLKDAIKNETRNENITMDEGNLSELAKTIEKEEEKEERESTALDNNSYNKRTCSKLEAEISELKKKKKDIIEKYKKIGSEKEERNPDLFIKDEKEFEKETDVLTLPYLKKDMGFFRSVISKITGFFGKYIEAAHKLSFEIMVKDKLHEKKKEEIEKVEKEIKSIEEKKEKNNCPNRFIEKVKKLIEKIAELPKGKIITIFKELKEKIVSKVNDFFKYGINLIKVLDKTHFIKNFFKSIFEAIIVIAKAGKIKIGQQIIGIISKIKDFKLESLFKTSKKMDTGTLKKCFEKATNFFLKAVGSILKTIAEPVINFLSLGGKLIWRLINRDYLSAWEHGGEIIGNIVHIFILPYTGIFEEITDPLAKVLEKGKDTLEGINLDEIGNIADAINEKEYDKKREKDNDENEKDEEKIKLHKDLSTLVGKYFINHRLLDEDLTKEKPFKTFKYFYDFTSKVIYIKSIDINVEVEVALNTELLKNEYSIQDEFITSSFVVLKKALSATLEKLRNFKENDDFKKLTKFDKNSICALAINEKVVEMMQTYFSYGDRSKILELSNTNKNTISLFQNFYLLFLSPNSGNIHSKSSYSDIYPGSSLFLTEKGLEFTISICERFLEYRLPTTDSLSPVKNWKEFDDTESFYTIYSNGIEKPESKKYISKYCVNYEGTFRRHLLFFNKKDNSIYEGFLKMYDKAVFQRVISPSDYLDIHSYLDLQLYYWNNWYNIPKNYKIVNFIDHYRKNSKKEEYYKLSKMKDPKSKSIFNLKPTFEFNEEVCLSEETRMTEKLVIENYDLVVLQYFLKNALDKEFYPESCFLDRNRILKLPKFGITPQAEFELFKDKVTSNEIKSTLAQVMIPYRSKSYLQMDHFHFRILINMFKCIHESMESTN